MVDMNNWCEKVIHSYAPGEKKWTEWCEISLIQIEYIVGRQDLLTVFRLDEDKNSDLDITILQALLKGVYPHISLCSDPTQLLNYFKAHKNEWIEYHTILPLKSNFTSPVTTLYFGKGLLGILYREYILTSSLFIKCPLTRTIKLHIE